MKLKKVTLLVADRCGKPDVEIKIGDHINLISKESIAFRGTITAIWDTVLEVKLDFVDTYKAFLYEEIDSVEIIRWTNKKSESKRAIALFVYIFLKKN